MWASWGSYPGQLADSAKRLTARTELRRSPLWPFKPSTSILSPTSSFSPEAKTPLAEVAVPRELFASILERIQWSGVPPPVQCG